MESERTKWISFSTCAKAPLINILFTCGCVHTRVNTSHYISKRVFLNNSQLKL